MRQNHSYAPKSREYRDRTREEKFRWDEANRLLAVSQDGYVSHYFYDASGERTVKMHGGNSAVFVNSQMSGRETGALSFSAYFNPYFSIHDGTRFTKHLYIGSERIASMTGELDEDYYDVANNNNIVHAGVEVYVNTNDLHIPYTDRCYAMRDSIDGNYSYFGLHSGLDWSGVQLRALSLPCHGEEDGSVSNGGGSIPRSQGSGTGNDYPSRYGSIWYFHKDHLGSSTLITDGTGSISQQVEYLPYGEVFLERQHNSDPSQPLYATPYRFNGKELDEETGLYYYGARYMNPRLSIWYATDPMQEKYPNISSYAYCLNNPLLYIDKDGNGVFESIRNKLYSLYNSFKGNSTYEGSGWGHGLRRYIANKLNIDNDAANVLEAVSLSLLQSKEINITGQALNKLKNDPDMKSFETDIIKDLKNNPNYKKRFFSDEFNKVVEFGGKRAPGEMKTQAIHFYDPKYKDTWDVAFNELTWFVRHARVFANASVSKTGSITITYNLVDCFDVRPSEGRSVEYNAICKYLGILYHDILGGNDKINVKATWKVKK